MSFNSILDALIQNGSLPPIVGQIQASSVVVRGNKIRQEFKEDDCGNIPFRLTETGAGNLSQRPISGSFHTALNMPADLGAAETRENIRHRIQPGPLPISANRILHLESSKEYITSPDGEPFTAWLDSSGEGNHVLQNTGSLQPSLVRTNESEYNSVRFNGTRNWLEIDNPPVDLQTLESKTIYITARMVSNESPSGGHGIELSASSTGQSLDVFHSFAVKNDPLGVQIWGAESKNSSIDISLVTTAPGADIAFFSDTDSVTDTELAELIIYTDLHDEGEIKSNLGYLLCKHLSSPVT